MYGLFAHNTSSEEGANRAADLFPQARFALNVFHILTTTKGNGNAVDKRIFSMNCEQEIHL